MRHWERQGQSFISESHSSRACSARSPGVEHTLTLAPLGPVLKVKCDGLHETKT